MKMAISKSGRRISVNTETAGLLMLDFSAIRQRGKHLLFKSRSLWCFVIAALADTGAHQIKKKGLVD